MRAFGNRDNLFESPRKAYVIINPIENNEVLVD
jgi:hypothetical protein